MALDVRAYLLPVVCFSVVPHGWQVWTVLALSESEWLWYHSGHLHNTVADSKTHCPHGDPKTSEWLKTWQRAQWHSLWKFGYFRTMMNWERRLKAQLHKANVCLTNPEWMRGMTRLRSSLCSWVSLKLIAWFITKVSTGLSSRSKTEGRERET